MLAPLGLYVHSRFDVVGARINTGEGIPGEKGVISARPELDDFGEI